MINIQSCYNILSKMLIFYTKNYEVYKETRERIPGTVVKKNTKYKSVNKNCFWGIPDDVAA